MHHVILWSKLYLPHAQLEHDAQAADSIKRAAFASLTSDIQIRHLSMDIVIYKLFHGMLDRGSMHAPVDIPDPSVMQSRG